MCVIQTGYLCHLTCVTHVSLSPCFKGAPKPVTCVTHASWTLITRVSFLCCCVSAGCVAVCLGAGLPCVRDLLGLGVDPVEHEGLECRV
jgi:hypothetical protein